MIWHDQIGGRLTLWGLCSTWGSPPDGPWAGRSGQGLVQPGCGMLGVSGGGTAGSGGKTPGTPALTAQVGPCVTCEAFGLKNSLSRVHAAASADRCAAVQAGLVGAPQLSNGVV